MVRTCLFFSSVWRYLHVCLHHSIKSIAVSALLVSVSLPLLSARMTRNVLFCRRSLCLLDVSRAGFSRARYCPRGTDCVCQAAREDRVYVIGHALAVPCVPCRHSRCLLDVSRAGFGRARYCSRDTDCARRVAQEDPLHAA